MALIPYFCKGTDRYDREFVPYRIVVCSIDKQRSHSKAFLKSTGVVYRQRAAAESEVKLAYNLLTIISENLSAFISRLYLCFHADKGTTINRN